MFLSRIFFIFKKEFFYFLAYTLPVCAMYGATHEFKISSLTSSTIKWYTVPSPLPPNSSSTWVVRVCGHRPPLLHVSDTHCRAFSPIRLVPFYIHLLLPPLRVNVGLRSVDLHSSHGEMTDAATFSHWSPLPHSRCGLCINERAHINVTWLLWGEEGTRWKFDSATTSWGTLLPSLHKRRELIKVLWLLS